MPGRALGSTWTKPAIWFYIGTLHHEMAEFVEAAKAYWRYRYFGGNPNPYVEKLLRAAEEGVALTEHRQWPIPTST